MTDEEHQKLLEIVRLQLLDIENVRSEIQLLQHKGGHILPPTQPPAAPPQASQLVIGYKKLDFTYPQYYTLAHYKYLVLSILTLIGGMAMLALPFQSSPNQSVPVGCVIYSATTSRRWSASQLKGGRMSASGKQHDKVLMCLTGQYGCGKTTFFYRVKHKVKCQLGSQLARYWL